MKFSRWFPGHMKPARPGVYERNLVYQYSYWDGLQWHLGGNLYDHLYSTPPSWNQSASWRGLASDPEAKP